MVNVAKIDSFFEKGENKNSISRSGEFIFGNGEEGG